MAKGLLSKYGRLKVYGKNPRKISDGAFTKLCESLERDPSFMMARGLVINEENEVIGGNQRLLALEAIGYERVPDEWIRLAQHKDGSWWSKAEQERFILLDNNPEGLSGEFDYDMMIENFNRECMAAAGIDFSNLPDEVVESTVEETEKEVEEGEHGERDKELEEFIKRREASRGQVGEMTETGYYLVGVWETFEQVFEFTEFLREKYGIEVDGQFVNGFELSKALGLEQKSSGLKFSVGKPVKELQEMAMDGTAAGWEVREDSDVEEGEEVTENEKDDSGGLDGVI